MFIENENLISSILLKGIVIEEFYIIKYLQLFYLGYTNILLVLYLKIYILKYNTKLLNIIYIQNFNIYILTEEEC